MPNECMSLKSGAATPADEPPAPAKIAASKIRVAVLTHPAFEITAMT
jgi:hypothetical protein